MIELPPKFKQALGNGVRTSLYPLVRIYEGYRIDDTIPEDAESINLSIKETTIKNLNDTYENYDPLLLNSPSIKNSADIINNKYTISSVSLSISNAPFQGKIFSDSIQNLLNAVVQVYYCANGIDSIEDCLLVYTGTIRRFNQSAETIKLELEDLTQQMLSNKIPSSLIDKEEYYKQDDIGKPYPMVYGFVDKSPVIARSLGENNMGELQQELTEFNIDKIGKKIQGLWTSPNNEEYGNTNLTNSHPLISNGYIKQIGTLSVYENNFVPIAQYLNYEKEWSYYVDGIYDDWVEGYNKITIDADRVYYFEQAGYNSSASVRVEGQAVINEGNLIGIPTRIYRPLDKMACVNRRLNISGQVLDQNRIYGFTGYDGIGNNSGNGSANNFIPWEEENAMNWAGYYQENWTEGDETWWIPTDCHENNAEQVTVTTNIDDYWKLHKPETKGFYPIDNLQDGLTDKGIWIIGKNEDGKSGFAYVKLYLKDNVGNFPCSSKMVYDAQYHSFDGMDYNGDYELAYGAEFFDNNASLVYGGQNLIDAQTLADNLHFPHVPNQSGDWRNINYGTQQSGTEDTVELINGFEELKTFNNTTAFENINFGMLKVPQYHTGYDDYSYCSVMLFNCYILQDAVIDQPLDKKFFADVSGRTQNDEVIVSAQNILKDILEDELNYKEGNVQLIDEIDSWQNSFTLNEQKEAKQVFEGLFKSSLMIPSFNANGQFKFIPIHQILNGISYTKIHNQDILKYSFSLTKLDDIKNQVNVKYKKNYGSGEFDKQTGYSLIDSNQNEFDNYDKITESMYPNDQSKWYSIDYYGLTSEEAKLEVETEYIRDDDTARKLQKRLVSWYANQHLITKIDLPVSYMNLEVGDYIKFSELIGGKLAFGYNYTVDTIKNGQVIYPVFFITKINKSLDKISIEAIQVNRGDYGSRVIVDEEDEIGGTIFDEGGNDGQANFDLADPNDNPSYDDDTIVEEEEFEIEEYLNVSWLNDDDNLNHSPTAIVSTTIEGEFDVDIFVILNEEPFQYGQPQTPLVMPEVQEGQEHSANNYFDHDIEYYFENGIRKGGRVYLSTPYLIPEGHPGIICILRITYQGTEYTQDLMFTQLYFTPPPLLLGDLNDDGSINILDVTIMAGAVAYDNTEHLPDTADMNGDGTVNLLDIVMLVTQIVNSNDGDEQGEDETSPT